MGLLKSPIRAIAFDLDGTLIDTAPDLAEAVNAMRGALKLAPLSEADVRTLMGAGIDFLVSRALVRSAPPSFLFLDHSSVRSLFVESYRRQLFKMSRVFPSVVDGLRALKSAGKPLCCVTNKPAEFALPILRAAQLQRELAFTLCADRPEDLKPSPALLRDACAGFDLTPDQLLYVGDSRIDVAAARAAGCRVVLVSYGYDPGPLGDLGADALIDRLTDLAPMCRQFDDPVAGDSGRQTGSRRRGARSGARAR